MVMPRSAKVDDMRHSAAKDRTLQDSPSESGNRQRDCSDPQTAVVVNHQDRPG